LQIIGVAFMPASGCQSAADEVIWIVVGDLKKVEAGIRELNLGEVVKLEAGKL
jgi:hypothetical protein